MGEAKTKRQRNLEFLHNYPLCVYCGKTAETIDHCPPRSFFYKREWPERFIFSACRFCNSEASRDEQVLSVLTRIRFSEDNELNSEKIKEFEKAMQGIINNQPLIALEWRNSKRIHQKSFMKSVFGVLGKELIQQGWGALSIGPLTEAAISRFLVKIGKALYFKYNKKILDGFIYGSHVSTLTVPNPTEFFEKLAEATPYIDTPVRSNKNLSDQFSIRLNHNIDLGALISVMYFSEQIIYYIIAVDKSLHDKIHDGTPLGDIAITKTYDCRLALSVASGVTHRPTA